jgi:Protein of unknown function (DUF2905)
MSLARFLIFLGVFFIIAGLLAAIVGRLPLRLGHLPGDIIWRGKNSAFYFPIVTCLLLSILLSLVLWLFGRR